MFGLEILDIVIGLMLVYLLLALFATAANEYIAAVMNLRGKELAKGLAKLLDDADSKDVLKEAFDGVRSGAAAAEASLTQRFYSHRLIRPLATRQGWIARQWPRFWRRSTDPRLPSYIPARTFAMALLDVLGVRDEAATLPRPVSPTGGTRPDSSTGETQPESPTGENPPPATTPVRGSAGGGRDAPGASKETLAARAELVRVLEILKNESPHDVNQALGGLTGLLGNANLPPAAKVRLLSTLTGTQTRLQNLHDSVEVWFNNAMDRVSGAYKRTAQGWLFILGLLIATCMNADTIDMWRRLEADDELRNAMVRRAEATVAALDTTLADSAATIPGDTAAPPADPATAPADTPPPVADQTDSPAGAPPQTPGNTAGAAGDGTAGNSARLAAVKQARANYLASRARLDSMELKLGWTQEEAVRVGLLRKDAPAKASTQTRTGTGPARQRAQGNRATPSPEDSVKVKKSWIPAGYHADFFPFDTRPGFLKLLGLLLTALAISLGAPFWFDLLNKVISIRAAGRSPEEKPKSPEGASTRIADRAPK